MPTPASSSSPKPRPSKLDPYVHLLGVKTDAEVAEISGLTPEAVRQYRKRRGIPSAAEAQAAAPAEALPPEPGEPVAEPAVAVPVATATAPPVTKSKSKAAVAPKATPTKGKSDTAKAEVKPAKRSKAGEEPNPEPAPATTSKPAAKPTRKARIESVRHLIGVLPDAEVAAQAGVSQTAIVIDRENRKIPEVGPAPAAETAPNRSSDTAWEDLPTEPGDRTAVLTSEPEPESKKQASRAKATSTPSTPGRVKRRRGAQVEDVAVPVPDLQPEPEQETTPATKPGRKSADALLEPFRSQLGTIDDGRMAEIAGVSRSVVGAYRRKHKIAAYDGYLWTAGSGTDGRIRRGEQTASPEAGAETPPAPSPSTKTRKRKTTQRQKAPRTPTTAAAAAPAPAVGTPKRRGPPSKLDPVRHLVGVLGDGEVAAQVGLTRSAVQMYRRKHDIPAPTKRVVPPVDVAAEVPAAPTTKPRGAPVGQTVSTAPTEQVEQVSSEVGVAQPVPAAPAPSRPLIAWRLTLRVGGVDVEKYAITADSASVGRIADAAGEVLRIERVGDGLV